MNSNSPIVDAVTGLTPDAVALLVRIMRLTSALAPERRSEFLRECQAVLGGDDPARLLAPVVDRWTREVTS